MVLVETSIVCALLAQTAFAASQAQPYGGQARAAYLQKDYRRSEELYLLALQELGGKDAINARVADTLDALCIVYNAQQRYSETEALYRRANAIREELFGPESLEVAESLNRLAHCYHDLRRLDYAITLQSRAVGILEKLYGSRHEQVAYGLQHLARFCNLHRDYGEAETAAARALGILEQKFGPNAPQLSTVLTLVAAVYLSQQRLDEAETAYVRAFRVGSSSGSIVGAAFNLNNLALLYRKSAKYERAERLHLIALEAIEAAYGAASPCLTSTLQGYAILLDLMQRRAEAQAMAARIERIAETSGGQACRP